MELVDRQQQIMHILHNRKEAPVVFLAKTLNVSQVTIRKDLSFLEQQGLLIRSFGGARLILDNYQKQPPSKPKQNLAKCASKLIYDNARLIIDSGNTTRALIPLLKDFHNLVVMTNSLAVADQILNIEPQPTLLMTGGSWDKRSESFQGAVAEQVLSAYNFDILFIGADGLDLTRGSTTYNESVSLSNKMADISNTVVLMLESHKIDRKIPNLELPWNKINILVTDSEIDSSCKQILEQKGINLLIA